MYIYIYTDESWWIKQKKYSINIKWICCERNIENIWNSWHMYAHIYINVSLPLAHSKNAGSVWNSTSSSLNIYPSSLNQPTNNPTCKRKCNCTISPFWSCKDCWDVELNGFTCWPDSTTKKRIFVTMKAVNMKFKTSGCTTSFFEFLIFPAFIGFLFKLLNPQATCTLGFGLLAPRSDNHLLAAFALHNVTVLTYSHYIHKSFTNRLLRTCI